MFKKSLILGSVTLVLLVLFALTGCSNPTDPGAGPTGGPGPLTLEGTIGGTALAEHFANNNDVIRLVSSGGGTTVFGTVPVGKKLEIAGDVDILVNETLTIANGGRVEILETGSLGARNTALAINEGDLDIQPGGSLYINGDLVLTYDRAEELFSEARPAEWGENGAINLGADGNVTNVNDLFGWDIPGIPGVVSTVITTLDGTRPANITNWNGNKRLILSAPNPATDFVITLHDVDLSGKGVLVMRVPLVLDNTGAYSHTLRASGGGGIIIAAPSETFGIQPALVLNQSELPTAVPIKVKGYLTTNGSIATKAIPPNVDLSSATLITDPAGSSPTFTFGSRQVVIGTIELPVNAAPPPSLTIAGETVGDLTAKVNLTIKDIKKSGTFPTAQLSLPAGDIQVERLIAPLAADTINISGGGVQTKLSPRSIPGKGIVAITDPALLLTGPIELTPDARLGITSNNNLGSGNAAQLDQLANIIGGRVLAGGLHFRFEGARRYLTGLNTTGDLWIGGDARFDAYGLTATEIVVENIYTLDGGGTISGKSRIQVTGDLIISDDLTVNEIGGFNVDGTVGAANGTIIADGTSLIVGPRAAVNIGALLVLGPGAYSAKSQVNITAAGAITIGTADDSFAIGDGLTIAPAVGEPGIGLLAVSAGGTTPAFFPSFTATVAPVLLSGEGISLPGGAATGAAFTVSGKNNVIDDGEISVRGNAVITLGRGTVSGSLVLQEGAKLSSAAATNGSYTADNANYTGTAPTNPRAYDTKGTILATGSGSPDKVTLTPNTATADGVFNSATERAP